MLPKESWKDVRRQFIKANGVENDHPIPLVQFYLTYLKQGIEPTKNAIDGLEWALTARAVRWIAALARRAADGCRRTLPGRSETLGPLAYSPHPGEHADAALQLLKEVEAKLGDDGDASKPAE